MKSLATAVAAALLLASAPSTAATEPTPAPTVLPFQEAFLKADVNGDHKLSQSEAKKGGFFSASSFTETDYDHDGTVTLFELGKAVTESTKDLLEEHGRHDKNRDGKVDREEATFGSRIYTVFDRADTNQDRGVDQEELKNYVAQSYYTDNADIPIVPNVIDKKF